MIVKLGQGIIKAGNRSLPNLPGRQCSDNSEAHSMPSSPVQAGGQGRTAGRTGYATTWLWAGGRAGHAAPWLGTAERVEFATPRLGAAGSHSSVEVARLLGHHASSKSP